MKTAIEGGNFHTVKVGEHWRLQPRRSPYMCPVVERNGIKLDPPEHTFMSIDPSHLTDGNLDNCCYFDVEIVSVTDEIICCKTISGIDGSYILFEVLNSDAIVRFYNKEVAV